jgi:hypothetical protein
MTNVGHEDHQEDEAGHEVAAFLMYGGSCM